MTLTQKEIESVKSLCDRASDAVCGARHEAYGHPVDNHKRTADLWSAYIETRALCSTNLRPRDVCMLNILQKVSRDAHAPAKDNLVDIIGYALNAEIVS